MFCLTRWLLTLFGLGWLIRPMDETEAGHMKERRRRFRSQMRAAFRELLSEDEA